MMFTMPCASSGDASMPDTNPMAAKPKPVSRPATALAIFGHHWNVDMMNALAVLPSRHSP